MALNFRLVTILNAIADSIIVSAATTLIFCKCLSPGKF